MLYDTHRFAMDLPQSLARTLHGNVKVMITSCSIRHLFALPTTTNPASDLQSLPAAPQTKSSPSQAEPISSFYTTPLSASSKTALLNLSRTLTLRKCGHHQLDAPLSTHECLATVFDPKGTGHNKHRLVLAAQDEGVRHWARQTVQGVPSVYVKRSVMVMEPMSALSESVREGGERGKLRGLAVQQAQQDQGQGEELKRKRTEEEEDNNDEGHEQRQSSQQRKKRKGPKGPNPLSVKKKKHKPPKNAAGTGPE